MIEARETNHTLLQEKGFCHVIGDATHEEVLEGAGIKKASGLLALLDDDPDNLFVVLSARELNPTLHIISRVDEGRSSHKIIRAGADKVISPFASTGKRIANDILSATGQGNDVDPTRNIQQDSALKWVDVAEGSDMVGCSVEQLAQHMGAPIMGLRRQGEDRLLPDESIIIQRDDQVLVLDGHVTTVNRLDARPKEAKRLVLVDDNPVIIKLYMRLFQKAGFMPLTANNGQAGLDLILKEKPDVAVIDYRLPLMSGIDVCRKVRKHLDQDQTKLILFTVDHRLETKQKALDAGANAVVVKSPEASEVIQTVCDHIML